MIFFPHAKINLGLHVISKRPDGFHNLETIFYPLPICDMLEAVPSPESNFYSSGLQVPGKREENLVWITYQILLKKYPQIGPLSVYLHKAIPMGAGLGGGSSDAAALIRLVYQMYNIPATKTEVNELALSVGSDCPFFMQNAACYATGRGEILESLSLDLSSYSFLLVHPEISISTAWAFSQVEPSESGTDLRKTILQPVENWKDTLRNSFEPAVFTRYPQLRQIKERLYANGALYAAMTGSGSTLFGIFPRNKLPELDFGATVQSRILQTDGTRMTGEG